MTTSPAHAQYEDLISDTQNTGSYIGTWLKYRSLVRIAGICLRRKTSARCCAAAVLKTSDDIVKVFHYNYTEK